MINARLRFLLVGFILAYAGYFIYTNGFTRPWLLLLLFIAASTLLASHFLFGTVWQAFLQLQKGKLEQAEDLLDKIKRPEWLVKGHKSYYYFIRGMIALQREELSEAKTALDQSLSIGLRRPNDNALVNLNLCHICYVQSDVEGAKKYLATAKSFNPTDLMIKRNLEELAEALGINN